MKNKSSNDYYIVFLQYHISRIEKIKFLEPRGLARLKLEIRAGHTRS